MNQLNESNFDMIWDQAMKHDAYRANILKVLTELSYQIKPSHAKYLFESKISKIELKDIDLFVLRLV